MQVVRVRNPKALGFIKEFLTPGEGFGSVEEMMAHLESLLAAYPKNTYFSFALEEDQNQINFFILAFAQPDTDLCILIQTWTRPSLKPFIANKMFELFQAWCEAGGFNRIRVETSRNPIELFNRRGFLPLYQVLEKNLLQEITDANSSSQDVRNFDEPTATTDGPTPG